MTGEVRTLTTGVSHTRALAAALGELSRPGDLLVLVGDLGAGKTAFVQGFGQGLGVREPITSPTFALVQSYRGRLDLHHLDAYRLEQVNEALDLNLAEMLDDDAVVVVEWGDTIAPVLPHDYLEVRMGYAEGGVDQRDLRFVPVGPRWSVRMRVVATVVEQHGGDGTPADGGGGA